MRFTLLIVLIISLNILHSQEITQNDYNRYIVDSDYSYIEKVVSEYGVLVNFQKIRFRVYGISFVLYGSTRQSYKTFDINHIKNYMSFEDFVPYEIERRKRYNESVARQKKINQQKEIEEKRRISKLKSEYVKSIDTLNVYNFLLQIPLNMILGCFEGIDKKTYKVNYEQDNSFNDFGITLNQRSNSLNEDNYEATYDIKHNTIMNNDETRNLFLSYKLKVLNVYDESSRKFYINDCQIENSFFNKTYVKSAEPEKNLENWSEKVLIDKVESTNKKNKEYRKHVLEGKYFNKNFNLNFEKNNGFFNTCTSLNELVKKNMILQIDETSGLIDTALTIENLSYGIYKKLLLQSLPTSFSYLENNDEWAKFFRPYLTKFIDEYYFPTLKSHIGDIEIDKNDFAENVIDIQNALNYSDFNKKNIYDDKDGLPIKIKQTKSTKKMSRFYCVINSGFRLTFDNPLDNNRSSNSGVNVASYLIKFPVISNGLNDSYLPFFIEFLSKEKKVKFYKAKYSKLGEFWEKDKKSLILSSNLTQAN